MVEAKAKVPEVLGSIAKVLAALSVEKNGELPGNMGGKSYITAVDASAEVKRQFVANDLILLSNEDITKHEILVGSDNRKTVAIGIKGTYTIISTKDGSRETVSGAGDGMAIGTSVSSNIASTNALKNALLRTFLITEQSVEDASKNGPTETDGATKPVPAAVAKAQAAKAPAKAPAKDAPASPPATTVRRASEHPIKAKIREEWVTPEKVSAARVTELAKQAVGFDNDDDKWAYVLKTLETGGA